MAPQAWGRQAGQVPSSLLKDGQAIIANGVEFVPIS
jgi:hypothetical protein